MPVSVPVSVPVGDLATAEHAGADALAASRRGPGWHRRYAATLVGVDLTLIAAAFALVPLTGVGAAASLSSSHYAGLAAAVAAVWLLMLFLTGCYEVRELALGVNEARRVLHGSAAAVGVGCFAAVLSGVGVPGRVLLVDVPLTLVLLGVGRLLVRALARHHRRHGRWADRVLAVGSAAAVRELTTTLSRRSGGAMVVVGACVSSDDPMTDSLSVPVLGGWADAIDAAVRVDADVVTIAGAGSGARAVRELGWALERSGRQLVTATELAEVASSRLQVRPVEGMPLVWVEHPRFTGPSRFVKRVVDLAGAGLGLLIASPLLLVIAALVKFSSAGPVFFRQRRLGKDGETISVWKFRTMCDNAEQMLQDVLDRNTGGNLLYFKAHDDPRITGIGRLLRRWSLDELPQLLNVMGGSMSLVGPRPLPGSLDLVEGDYRRRLLVRPGLTGLWQVSGRSDLPTDDALRLDLYYVENWTLGLDFAIIARTLGAVIASRGAY